MANSDYQIGVQTFGFCPYAKIALAVPIEPGPTYVEMNSLRASTPNPIRVGMAAMIGGEIVSVLSRSGNNLLLGRGCCDTVPAAHPANSTIWFFDDSLASDEVEYAPTQTLSVKLLPRTASGGPVPIEASPPNQVTMNWRFARPYPPGYVRANADTWLVPQRIDEVNPALVLTWAHRDRISQQDQLIDHTFGSIGPEAGTSYRLRLYRASDDTMVRYISDIAAAGYSYLWDEAAADFAVAGSDIAAYAVLDSMRAGLESWQSYRIEFTVTPTLMRGDVTGSGDAAGDLTVEPAP